MVIENSKITNFWTIFLDQFLLQHVSILNSNPIYQHNIFLLASSFKKLKNQRYSHPCRPFLLENGFIMISKLRHWYNFLQWQVLIFMEDLMQMNVFSWIYPIFVWIFTIFAQLITGCAIRYPKTGNLCYVG